MSKTLFMLLSTFGVAIFIGGQATPTIVYVAMIGSIMVRVSANVIGAALLAEGAMIAERISRMSSALVTLLIQYWLLSQGFGVATWSLSILVATFIYLVLAATLSARVRTILRAGRFSPNIFCKYRRDHFNWLFFMIPTMFIFNFQIFALKIWSTSEAVALFSGAHQLYYSAISVFSMTRTISSVIISKHHYSQSSARNYAVFVHLRIFSFLVAFAMAMVSIFLIPVGSSIFSTLSFSQYALAFDLYGLILVLEATQIALTDGLMSTGDTNFKFVNTASAILNILGCYILVPRFGIVGAILSVGLAQLVTCNYFNITKAIRVLALPSGEVVRSILAAVGAYVALVAMHTLAYEVGLHAGQITDALLTLIVLVFVFIRLAPRIFAIVAEYSRYKH